MARKPCAQNVPQLPVDCQFDCTKTGRFRRIARNAVLPFYYNCDNKLPDGSCSKVFYIKNPQYFAGAAKNTPNSQVTQAMIYSHLAKSNGRNFQGKRTSILLKPPSSCINPNPSLFNWYNLPNFDLIVNDKINPKCICGKTPGLNINLLVNQLKN